ncbi:MAG: VIT1/CCC1 transporter family protein [Microthrixaceae bacterium]
MPHNQRVARRHSEVHRSDRAGWLRATVMGANDGILSTGALLLGVVGAGEARAMVLTAGLAGLVAGAGSMGIGEYVSVSSQRDAEEADRAIEERELRATRAASTPSCRASTSAAAWGRTSPLRSPRS